MATVGTNDRQGGTVMLQKAYSVAYLVADILLLLVKMLIGIVEAIYTTFVPPKEKSVSGEIVLISGTGHGIGRELALQYASLGATVVCLDINEVANLETVKQINDRGLGKAYSFICDVSKREDVQKTGEKIQFEVGDVSVLINNAGIMPCHPFSSTNEAEIKKIFDINIYAHFWMLETFLPVMIKNNHGHVVAISSMAGILGITNLVPYCASKFAVRGMMEALAEEMRENFGHVDVRFTTIYPYIVDTGLCKKPKIRFPSLLGIVTPQEAARQIIQAMRRNYMEVTIPSGLLAVNNTVRMLPVKVSRLIKDFLDSGVESHD